MRSPKLKARIMSKAGTRPVRPGRPPKHGWRQTRTYNAWRNLRAACDNPKNPRYKTTGARGITYPRAWDTFEGFLDEMGEAPAGASLKRHDVALNYDTKNCYWS